MADNSYRTSNLGPRVSHATTKAFTAGPGHYVIPSWMTFEVLGNFVTGASGAGISAIRSSTISVSPGAVAAADSISTTATISLMPADAVILAAQPASIWSGAYYDISISAMVSAASTLRIGLANSTHTSVTPDAMNWTVVYMDPA